MRRFFRIHLSTAFVLMLLAGGLLGLNLIPRSEQVDEHTISYRGWPNVYWVQSTYDSQREWKRLDIAKWTAQKFGNEHEVAYMNQVSRLSITEVRHRIAMEGIISKADADSFQSQRISRAVKNGVVAFFVIIVAGFFMEWRLRRAAQPSLAKVQPPAAGNSTPQEAE